jgi:hypothetical protein
MLILSANHELDVHAEMFSITFETKLRRGMSWRDALR